MLAETPIQKQPRSLNDKLDVVVIPPPPERYPTHSGQCTEVHSASSTGKLAAHGSHYS